MNIEIDSEFKTEESRWQAVTKRDRNADGAFFFAVRTTDVLCWPSCASRAPRRENVEFFATTDAAERASYRPCKRCQSTSLPHELAIVEHACKVLDADPQQHITLMQLGDAVHVSIRSTCSVCTRIVRNRRGSIRRHGARACCARRFSAAATLRAPRTMSNSACRRACMRRHRRNRG